MLISIKFMLSIQNVDYITSFCKRGKYAKFLVGKKWFYLFFDNLTVEIEDTNKIVKTIKNLKTQFKKYSGGEELVFSSIEP
jgi:predicted metal-binding protein